MIFIIVFVLFCSPLTVKTADEFEDYRCKCVCPPMKDLQNASNTEKDRRIYIDVVPAANCSCESVVFRSISTTDEFKKGFCLRCSCNYEVRNTTTMKVVVIIIMVSISLLLIYMTFLLCLDPMMNRNNKQSTINVRASKHYQRQVNDDQIPNENAGQENVSNEPTEPEEQTNRSRSSTVLSLVTQGQSKWRKQVQQQRQSVYNRHDILN